MNIERMSRPVVHIVWLKIKGDVSEDALKHLYVGMDSLRTIPGVLSVDYGVNFTQRSRGYNVGLLVHLRDKAALEVFKTHETHVKFINEYIIPVKDDDAQAMDFESNL